MKIATVTCVYNESIFLERWLGYYSQFADTVHVVDNFTDDGSVEKAKEKFKFDTSPLEASHYDIGIWQVITNRFKKITKGLLGSHDCVIVADVDEFILPDPKKYTGLRDYINKMKQDYARCSAWNIVQVEGEKSIDWERPLLKQRQYWKENVGLCKPLITKVPLDWVPGQHRIRGITRTPDPDLILAHLRDIDTQLFRERVVKTVCRDDKLLRKIPLRYREIKI